jgi:nicotinamide-nucleotide amidase
MAIDEGGASEGLMVVARVLADALVRRGHVLATAESCTGGWVGQVLTAISGSSGWYDRGFITYSNDAKQEMLGVPPATIRDFGAVSIETAEAMARGALVHSRATLSLAITGVAGPTGGTERNPVGTVCFAWASRAHPGVRGVDRDPSSTEINCTTARLHLTGDREQVRHQAVQVALEGAMRASHGRDAS